MIKKATFINDHFNYYTHYIHCLLKFDGGEVERGCEDESQECGGL